MIISCKTCRKIHVDGEWTEETSVEENRRCFTFCRTCLFELKYGREAFYSRAGLSEAYAYYQQV